ncbi:MAG: acyl carrier protein [Clostridia bacterium]|jgi:acyl carrier protein|nr:acyl carrier protein [Clostridia bacterium]
MIFEKVKALLCDNLGIDENDVTMDANLIDDLNIDSLDVVELIMAVEEEFGIEIPDEDVEKVTTVGNMVDYIASKL